MSSEQSSTSTYYDMNMGSNPNVIEVRDRQRNLVATVQPGTYTVNGKSIQAWDLRKYTMGNFDLKAKTNNGRTILTYYAGFKPMSDGLNYNF